MFLWEMEKFSCIVECALRSIGLVSLSNNRDSNVISLLCQFKCVVKYEFSFLVSMRQKVIKCNSVPLQSESLSTTPRLALKKRYKTTRK